MISLIIDECLHDAARTRGEAHKGEKGASIKSAFSEFLKCSYAIFLMIPVSRQ